MLRAIFSIGFLQGLTLLANVTRAKALALMLGPAGFGVIATIDQLVQSSAQLSNLSVPFTALKYLSHRHSISDAAFGRAYIRFLRVMMVLTATATVLALILLPRLLAVFDSELARYSGIVRLALLGLPAAMLVVFFVNVLAARQQSTASAALQLTSAAVIAVASVAGCMANGIGGVYTAVVPAASVVVIVAAYVLRPRTASQVAARADTIPVDRTAVVRTAALTYVAVGSTAILLLVARYVSLAGLGESAAGILQAALAAALSIGAVLAPANTLYLAPFVNRSMPRHDKVAATHRFVPRLFLIFCVAAVPVMLFPSLVLRLLFSERFLEARELLPWFVVWQGLLQTANIYQQLLIGLDDVLAACLAITGASMVSTALSLFLIGPFGLVGVAGAFVVGGMTNLCATVLRVWWVDGGFPPRIAIVILLGMAGLPAIWAVAAQLPETSLAGVLYRGGIALVYMTFLWTTAPIDFRQEIRNAITRPTAR